MQQWLKHAWPAEWGQRLWQRMRALGRSTVQDARSPHGLEYELVRTSVEGDVTAALDAAVSLLCLNRDDRAVCVGQFERLDDGTVFRVVSASAALAFIRGRALQAPEDVLTGPLERAFLEPCLLTPAPGGKRPPDRPVGTPTWDWQLLEENMPAATWIACRQCTRTEQGTPWAGRGWPARSLSADGRSLDDEQVLGLLRGLLRRHSQDEALKRDLADMRRQSSLLPVAWLHLDAESRTVVAASHECALRLGLTLAETAGMSAADLVDPGMASQTIDELMKPASQGPQRTTQIHLRHSNGEVLVCRGNGVGLRPCMPRSGESSWVLWVLDFSAREASSPANTCDVRWLLDENNQRHHIASVVLSDLMTRLRPLRGALLDSVPQAKRTSVCEALDALALACETAAISVAQPLVGSDELEGALRAMSRQGLAGLDTPCEVRCVGTHGPLAAEVRQVILQVIRDLLLMHRGACGQICIELEGVEGQILRVRLLRVRRDLHHPNRDAVPPSAERDQGRHSIPDQWRAQRSLEPTELVGRVPALGLFGVRLRLASIGAAFTVQPGGQDDVLVEFQLPCGTRRAAALLIPTGLPDRRAPSSTQRRDPA